MKGAGTFRNQVAGRSDADFTTKFSEATGSATIAGAAAPAQGLRAARETLAMAVILR
jgi:hypothetical protein